MLVSAAAEANVRRSISRLRPPVPCSQGFLSGARDHLQRGVLRWFHPGRRRPSFRVDRERRLSTDRSHIHRPRNHPLGGGGPCLSGHGGVHGHRLSIQAAERRAATKSVTRTEDTGDPADQGFGYFTIDLGLLAGPAHTFILTNGFIRSSFGTPICGGGGLACFSFGCMITCTIQLDPTTKDQCMNGGWRDFPEFKNQGQCIAFVNHAP